MKNRITYRLSIDINTHVLIVFRSGKTANKKISAGGHIVQTYTFSKGQFDHFAAGGNVMDMFKYDDACCLDCPFSYRSGGGCYTHKFPQARGFASMLKSIVKEYNGNWANIPTAEHNDWTVPAKVVEMCRGRYVRFGTYGEPVFIPHRWVSAIVAAAKTHTGYTHQWNKEEYQGYRRYFMASVEGQFLAKIAREKGWRSFNVINERSQSAGMVNCPASSEAGYKTTCEACNLCGGASKIAKDVYIYEH